MSFLNQILITAIISYMSVTVSILYILPSSTYNLFKSENTTLDRIMTETELSFMGSISAASTLIVTPFCGYLMDTLGRKGTIIFFFVPQLLAWGLIVTVFRVEAFIFSMFLCGLSGSVYFIGPVFISEYCDPRIRGAMASTVSIFHGVGMMVSYLLGGLLDYNTMIYTGLIMNIVGFVLLWFIKESPLYLMKRKYEKKAAKSIAFYRGIKSSSIEVMKEMANIRRLLSDDIQIDTTPEEQMLNPIENKPKEKIPAWKYLILAQNLSTRRALAIVLVIYTSSLFQGLSVVQVYASPLFEEAVPSMTPILSSVMFALINVGAGILGAYLIDAAGRRILIIISSIATGLSCVILGTHTQFDWGPTWLNAFLLYLYSITYSVGPAIVPVVLMGEVFLPEIKSFAIMVCMEWGFISVFIITFIFNPLFIAYGLGPLFYLFAVFSFFTAIFCYIYLPETKGLPVDVVQQKFMQRKNIYT